MASLNLRRWRNLDFQELINRLRSFNPYHVVRPLLFQLDPEVAHHVSVLLLKKGLTPRIKNDREASLRSKVCGLDFPNPVGLAAGFDKQAELINEMINFGFGFVEIGTVTPLPQPGNSGPRLFRDVKAEAIINRFGFNSDGLDFCLRRVIAHHDETVKGRSGIVGINIGRNKDSEDATKDYTTGVNAFAPWVDYITINISSPNTPGLRDLQGREALAALLQKVIEERNLGRKRPPVFVKIAPDQTEEQKKDIADVVLASGIDGMIVSNTTLARPDNLAPEFAKETGGLSGRPLFLMSTQLLSDMYRLTEGKIPLIGSGGVFSGADAYAKIRAGASLVQIYTALIYDGPMTVARINRELALLLRRDGFKSVADAIGADHR